MDPLSMYRLLSSHWTKTLATRNLTLGFDSRRDISPVLKSFGDRKNKEKGKPVHAIVKPIL